MSEDNNTLKPCEQCGEYVELTKTTEAVQGMPAEIWASTSCPTMYWQDKPWGTYTVSYTRTDLAVNVMSNKDTLYSKVLTFFKGDAQKTTTWFNTSNSMLGDVSPMDMLMEGKAEKLEKFIDEQLAGGTGK